MWLRRRVCIGENETFVRIGIRIIALYTFQSSRVEPRRAGLAPKLNRL